MAYINGIGIVSPQVTDGDFLNEIREYRAHFMPAIDPDYKKYINPIAARRMSRLIKMGITSAKMAVDESGVSIPDAIITGTGLGSVEDTEKLLSELKEDRQLLNPTPFIQSTYNTISSQIAITLKCHNYNSTYVHRSFSFESALQDGLLQLAEGSSKNVLVGGIDEMTEVHLNIIRRLNHWKREPASNLELFRYETPGALAGEGASYFLIGQEKTASTYCGIKGVRFFYKPDGINAIHTQITDFLSEHDLGPSDVDLIIAGYNGDKQFDTLYDSVLDSMFPEQPVAVFKHLCGEYYTSSGIGLWLGARIIRDQVVPETVRFNKKPVHATKRILIYNQYRNTHHSLILLS